VLREFKAKLKWPSAVVAGLAKNFFGADVWLKLGRNVEKVPTLPKELTVEFLNEKCDLYPKQTRKEPHLLLLLPEGVSLKDLDEMCGKKSINGFSTQDWAKEEEFWTTKSRESRRVFIPKEGIPGTLSKTFEQQSIILKQYPNYGTSTALELFSGAVLNFVKNEERILGNNLLWCSDETGDGVRAAGGYFDVSGFRVFGDLIGLSFLSLARSGFRKFK